MDNSYQGIGILGGSFNPVHIGHLRLAMEIFENFHLKLQYIDLVPCARPAHKDINGLLPFSLRVELLNSAIENVDCLKINTLESLRQGTSYTYDTLLEYNTKFSCQELFFIIGENDFLTIKSWHKGIYLPEQTNIIVVSQLNNGSFDFQTNIKGFWPQIKCNFDNYAPIFSLPNTKTKIYYLQLTILDISASMIRKLWIQGKSIKYITPNSVISLLKANKEITNKYWL